MMSEHENMVNIGEGCGVDIWIPRQTFDEFVDVFARLRATYGADVIAAILKSGRL